MGLTIMSDALSEAGRVEPKLVPATQAQTLRFFIACCATSVAILAQAVTAGVFVNKTGADNWVTVHGLIADVSWVLALLTAIIGFFSIRRATPRLEYWAIALFVVTLAQTGLGHLITDYGDDSLIEVHVPLAMVIFGLTVWITVRAGRLHRVNTGAPAGVR
jgi:hypothetical protein